MRHLILLPIILLAACSTTKTVPVAQPVVVEGPTRHVPVPAALTACEDTGEPPALGQPLGDLFAWAQRTRAAVVGCQAKLEEIRSLASKSPDQ